MTSSPLLAKPLEGGLFGHDEYELATLPCIDRGLHGVRYMVIARREGLVVSVAGEKQEALACARRAIVAAGVRQAANDEGGPLQAELWHSSELPSSRAIAPAPAVSRRRRDIFERSGGICHYCGTQIEIGAFEIEHQRPRALGGGDDALNLVAACIRCNRLKGPLTAIEFVTSAAGRESS